MKNIYAYFISLLVTFNIIAYASDKPKVTFSHIEKRTRTPEGEVITKIPLKTTKQEAFAKRGRQSGGRNLLSNKK